MPKRHGFRFDAAEFHDMAEQVLARAMRGGASGCECEVSEGYGLTVAVRKGKPDTIEHNRDRSIGVSIYLGERPKVRRGHASTSDVSRAALEQTVDAALAIARHTAEDDCAGLPEPELLAKKVPDLDLFHPWALGTEEAIALAKRCEDAAFATAPVIKNSEGATVSTQQSQFVLANSLGFRGGFPGSRHYLSCAVIAEEKGLMQRDDWYSASRVPRKIAEPRSLGSYSARKLGMKSTGNAGGHHNLVLKSNGPDFVGMLRKMGRGLLVTELLGQGINLVTGDYSRGAAGYWVDGGEIQFPVEEITIAGNLRDIFKGIVSVGSDVLTRSGRKSGSILIERMTIAGE